MRADICRRTSAGVELMPMVVGNLVMALDFNRVAYLLCNETEWLIPFRDLFQEQCFGCLKLVMTVSLSPTIVMASFCFQTFQVA
jgi:hypothetical protein